MLPWRRSAAAAVECCCRPAVGDGAAATATQVRWMGIAAVNMHMGLGSCASCGVARARGCHACAAGVQRSMGWACAGPRATETHSQTRKSATPTNRKACLRAGVTFLL